MTRSQLKSHPMGEGKFCGTFIQGSAYVVRLLGYFLSGVDSLTPVLSALWAFASVRSANSLRRFPSGSSRLLDCASFSAVEQVSYDSSIPLAYGNPGRFAGGS
jgi:hypothetical protein